MLELISRLGLTQAQAAQEASASASAVGHWLHGTNTTRPSTLTAGVAMLDWYEMAQHRPSPVAAEAPQLYDAAEANTVLELIGRLGLTHTQAAQEASADASAVRHGRISDWLHGRNTTWPSTLAAGAVMLNWYRMTQPQPTPEAAEGPRPYDAAEAKRVLELIGRLGLTKIQAAREARASTSAVNKWLRGLQTTSPSTLTAGVAMLDWYETAQHRARTPAHDLAEHNTASDKVSEAINMESGGLCSPRRLGPATNRYIPDVGDGRSDAQRRAFGTQAMAAGINDTNRKRRRGGGMPRAESVKRLAASLRPDEQPAKTVGDKVSVYWPHELRSFEGTVVEVDGTRSVKVLYEDDDLCWAELVGSRWECRWMPAGSDGRGERLSRKRCREGTLKREMPRRGQPPTDDAEPSGCRALCRETKTQPRPLGAALIKTEEGGVACMPARLDAGWAEEKPLPTYRQQLALAMQESVRTSDVKVEILFF